ncbi:glycerate kinase [Gulosibacter sp. 10]|uniref:glycerate kinase n=1 Tax=Gulosibacter sp. 10 TaxID=1255570 RepID=UPI00097EE21C|nr:glycerate kinase [Gulosibacter sp. 10]SJM69465.1 Glycerate kinase [Gulosibacter sp. 10]
MRIVIAPDKFKGSASAVEAAEALAEGVREALEGAEVRCLPMADGGEGTVDAAIAAGYEPLATRVRGPLGAPVEARWAMDGRTAVIEMATASGLELVPEAERDGPAATSFGTGELITAALDAGADHIVLGIGGSASTDGGAGMLEALGLRLRDASGQPVGPGGLGLLRLAEVDASELDPRIRDTRFTLASDVDNPLCGPRGAAAVFGPQKGLAPREVEQVDQALARWAELLCTALDRPKNFGNRPGAGAAGGVGFAALTALEASARPGAELVAELVGLDALLEDAELVITGEGSFDEQSLGGKTPMGVLAAAKRRGVPAVVACGRSLLEERQWREAGFAACFDVLGRAGSTEESIRGALPLLRGIGAEIARTAPFAQTAAAADG